MQAKDIRAKILAKIQEQADSDHDWTLNQMWDSLRFV
jgi:hypothetical protein